MCKDQFCVCQTDSDLLLDLFMDIWTPLFTYEEEARIEHESREG